jgi:Protein of unknown function (DUF3433)
MAIFFSIVWKCIFSRLKEMEPFYQLSKPGGAQGSDSLLLTYLTDNMVKIFYGSAVRKHVLALVGSLNMLLVTLCTALAAEVLFVTVADSACNVNLDPNDPSNNCHPRLQMRPGLAWFLGVVVFAIFALTVFLILRLRHRSSGIFAEATSIAGIATLYSRAYSPQPQQILAHPSFKYGLQESHDGAGSNIIVGLSSTGSQLTTTPLQRRKKSQSRHISAHPVIVAVFWLFLVAILILILYYRFVSQPGTGNGLETFMDSQSFGVRLFMSCIGIAIKLYWGMLETYIRRKAPFAAMASPDGAASHESILVRTPSNPITALFYHSTWASPVLAVTTIMTILSEMLVITLTAIPFSVATARTAFDISVYISTVILSMMIIAIPIFVLPVMVTWRFVRADDIPEPSESIAETIALLADSDVATRFAGLGTSTGSEREAIVRSWSDFRWFVKRVTPVEKGGRCSEWCLGAKGPERGPLQPDAYV